MKNFSPPTEKIQAVVVRLIESPLNNRRMEIDKIYSKVSRLASEVKQARLGRG